MLGKLGRNFQGWVLERMKSEEKFPLFLFNLFYPRPKIITEEIETAKKKISVGTLSLNSEFTAPETSNASNTYFYF